MAAPFRVALASYSTAGDIGGVTTWFRRLALALRDRGLEVFVLLLHEGEGPSSLARDLAAEGLSVQLLEKHASFAVNVQTTVRFLNQTRPRVFLPQCLPEYVVAAAAAGRRGLPWVFTFHSDDPQYWSSLPVVMPQWCGGEIVCVSHHLASEVRRRIRDSAPRVIPCGVPIPARVVAPADGGLRVVYSGRLAETQKRISLVLEALMLACHADAAITARLIGDGPALVDLQRRVTSEGLAARIAFTGRVESDAVPGLLADCQVILMMSDYEGLPVALMEAMAQGVVPVVRSIASGIPELVEDGRSGLLVTDDPADAARAIRRLAGDPGLWQRCQQEARQRIVSAYSADGCQSLWYELLDRLNAGSRVTYPLRLPWLSVRSAVSAALIDLLWVLYERKGSWNQAFDSASARIKHALRSLVR